ncbi:hypothetical protein JW968_00925 [Candidatus Woesearchaeota archaeon]|nr:hypothetical protein [Candidatus Woesearchaeota archaeon]
MDPKKKKPKNAEPEDIPVFETSHLSVSSIDDRLNPSRIDTQTMNYMILPDGSVQESVKGHDGESMTQIFLRRGIGVEELSGKKSSAQDASVSASDARPDLSSIVGYVPVCRFATVKEHGSGRTLPDFQKMEERFGLYSNIVVPYLDYQKQLIVQDSSHVPFSFFQEAHIDNDTGIAYLPFHMLLDMSVSLYLASRERVEVLEGAVNHLKECRKADIDAYTRVMDSHKKSLAKQKAQLEAKYSRALSEALSASDGDEGLRKQLESAQVELESARERLDGLAGVAEQYAALMQMHGDAVEALEIKEGRISDLEAMVRDLSEQQDESHGILLKLTEELERLHKEEVPERIMAPKIKEATDRYQREISELRIRLAESEEMNKELAEVANGAPRVVVNIPTVPYGSQYVLVYRLNTHGIEDKKDINDRIWQIRDGFLGPFANFDIDVYDTMIGVRWKVAGDPIKDFSKLARLERELRGLYRRTHHFGLKLCMLDGDVDLNGILQDASLNDFFGRYFGQMSQGRYNGSLSTAEGDILLNPRAGGYISFLKNNNGLNGSFEILNRELAKTAFGQEKIAYKVLRKVTS